MALIVEDGTGLVNANSYIAIVEARAYANDRGLILPAADPDLEKLLIKAMDFIEAMAGEFQGVKTSPNQALQWPRSDVVLDGYPFDSHALPKTLKLAQSQLVTDANLQDLMPSGSGKEVVSEKVDVIEIQYAQSGSTNPQPIFTKAKALLKPLLKRNLFDGALRSIRV